MSLLTVAALMMPFWEEPKRPSLTGTKPPIIHSVSHGNRGNWAKPRRWCGWYMRKLKGVSDPKYNRAIAWAQYGVPVSGPQVNAIVVWRNHVGILTGYAGNGKWYVHSGNDSNRVQTRARSLKGVLAYRI